MSTDAMTVLYDSEETGQPLMGTLRFHNASGMASWQPADVEEPGKTVFSRRELVALAKAVLRHEGYQVVKPLPFPSASVSKERK